MSVSFRASKSYQKYMYLYAYELPEIISLSFTLLIFIQHALKCYLCTLIFCTLRNYLISIIIGADDMGTIYQCIVGI